MPKSDKGRGFFYQALGGDIADAPAEEKSFLQHGYTPKDESFISKGIEPVPRFFPQPPTEPQDASAKRESFFSKGLPDYRADREPDASWYRPSNHKPNVYPNTLEQAAYQKREEEKARSSEAIHSFFGKVGYEVMEGVKRGFVPDYYDKWLESLTPEERARRGLPEPQTESESIENRCAKKHLGFMGFGGKPLHYKACVWAEEERQKQNELEEQ